MKKPVTRHVAIPAVLGAVLAACASTTPEASPPAAATQAPAVAAAPGAKSLDIPGFRRVVRNGEESFCQTRGATGSRARSTEVCMSREEVRLMEEDHERLRRDAQDAGSRSTFTLDSPQ